LEVTKYIADDDPAKCRLESRKLHLSTAEFDAMKWPIDYLPPGWDIAPGRSNADFVKHAIRTLSAKITKEQRLYQHLGWVKLQQENREYWVYLHAGGAIGADGSLPIETDLERVGLTKYALPEPLAGADLIGGIKKVLQFRELAHEGRPGSHGLAVVCLSLLWRAAFDMCAFSVLFVGQSGARKTTMAQLVLNHFASRTLPGRPSDASVDPTEARNPISKGDHHLESWREDVPDGGEAWAATWPAGTRSVRLTRERSRAGR
jgi:hypothetical protein